ncbi:MAG: glucuronate isomerase, partial [Planctomycetes bacterium]|nr:glucuronate isomerase [Planctomycetota bacterium]
YLYALKNRHHYFAANGCTVSDHGLEHIYAEEYTDEEIREIFEKVRAEKRVTNSEKVKFKSAMLYNFAVWNQEKDWVQQFHLGALRNNNSRLLSQLGPDTGFDSIGDFNQARPLSRFLNKLDKDDRLAKTIIYNLNPADNEMMAAMIGNFNDGSVAGKIQYGSAWWFQDQ